MGQSPPDTPTDQEPDHGYRLPDAGRIYSEIFAMALAMAGRLEDPDTAQDIAAAVCDEVLRRLAKDPAFKWASGFVLQSVKHHVLDYRKARRRQDVHGAAYEAEREEGQRALMDPFTSQVKRDEGRARAGKLNALTPPCRDDWIRVREEGWPLAEAAAERDVTIAAVKFNLVRTRKALHEPRSEYRVDALSHGGFMPPATSNKRPLLDDVLEEE